MSSLLQYMSFAMLAITSILCVLAWSAHKEGDLKTAFKWMSFTVSYSLLAHVFYVASCALRK